MRRRIVLFLAVAALMIADVHAQYPCMWWRGWRRSFGCLGGIGSLWGFLRAVFGLALVALLSTFISA
ncbi:MAG: hypothetical protein ACP5I3_08805 [Thermoproteus sp.]